MTCERETYKQGNILEQRERRKRATQAGGGRERKDERGEKISD